MDGVGQSTGAIGGGAGRPAYRRELDGLRAVAVAAVILCHAKLGLLPSGYLGVDVFFVLSGYLITAIVQGDLEAGHFSLRRFYERRVRRIAPALTVMMLVCTPLAIAVMLPDDLENYGQSLIATILFVNNVLLMLTTTNYFSASIDFKPLMHSWSLGVEEQYYLLAPLILIGLFGLRRRVGTVSVMTVLTLISFLLSLWLARAQPTANFYLAPTRAWELGIGSLLALAAAPVRGALIGATLRQALALFGLLLVVAPMLMVLKRPALAPWHILLPVIGSALLICFAAPGNIVGRLLGMRPAVALGLISYSAYLYHQPVFAFARIVSLDEPSRRMMAALIVPVLLLAWASWRFVERPFRASGRVSARAVIAAWLGGSALLLAAAAAIIATSGFYDRWTELADGDAGLGSNRNAAYNSAPEAYRDRPFPPPATKVDLLVIGNSEARDFINMVRESPYAARIAISYPRDERCRPTRPSPKLQRLLRGADFIVFGPGDTPCTLDRMAAYRPLTHARMIVLGPKNFGSSNAAVMLLAPDRRYAARAVPSPGVRMGNARAARVFPPDTYVDILAALADGSGRVPVFTPDRRFISQDGRHLTRAGARYVGGIVFDTPALRPLARAASRQPQTIVRRDGRR